MVGVSTYTPPVSAHADINKCDVEHALSQVIAYIARDAGFSGVRRHALDRFGEMVDTCTSTALTPVMMTLLHSCTQFSQLSNRTHPSVYDVMDTFEMLGLSHAELGQYAAAQVRIRSARAHQINVAEPKRGHENWENPSAAFLAPNDESVQTDTSTWNTLMHDIVPDHLPPEPPRHCWMFTPVYATEMLSGMPTLQLVNRKLDNARLVESSLRKLIKHTDTAAPPKLWTPPAKEAPKATEQEVGDVSLMSVDETDAPVYDLPVPAKPEHSSVEAHDASRRVLPRAVNYKAAWYTAMSSTDSKLPTANLYTARLRGNMDDSARRTRRYIVPP